MNVTILYNKAKCINCCHPHGQKYVSCGLTIDEKKIYIYISSFWLPVLRSFKGEEE